MPIALPARILGDWAEFRAAEDAARGALDRFQPRADITPGETEEMVSAALAAVGVFEPPPHPDSLEPDNCTALFLPPAESGSSLFGAWQQCVTEPGHAGPWHDCGPVSWQDGQPGTLPARPPRP
ncbi:hypothetical protein GCM10010357_70920 [Streptomyces luteireticuli]|uniref:Uncharacterized protein n=1 Tax=Streptomyces luteireticuli TaxID=173858 RepID=A0ABN0Z8U5_9ACTN